MIRAGGALVVATALAALACGGPSADASRASSPAASVQSAAPAPARASSASSAAVARLPSLDALAARGPSVAPLMREALRVADAKRSAAELKAERDTCFRATVAATADVKAYFADAGGAPRGDAFEGVDGAVPPGGPACVKRGDVVRLIIDGGGEATVRAVVFAAP